ncbi:hypothetical protein ACIBKY_54575 [Nonomuraea sp. NPDC050394]|uniref:hypothetical protein n=1 Tax=Nonomuraea sp. NPDC050394 TaxID=3364363 RepID=UPI003789E61C
MSRLLDLRHRTQPPLRHDLGPSTCQMAKLTWKTIHTGSVTLSGIEATQDLVEHMKGLNTTRRTVCFTVGWKITETDGSAIAKLPKNARQAAISRDGEVLAHTQAAELLSADGQPCGRPGCLDPLLGLHDDPELARAEPQSSVTACGTCPPGWSVTPAGGP